MAFVGTPQVNAGILGTIGAIGGGIIGGITGGPAGAIVGIRTGSRIGGAIEGGRPAPFSPPAIPRAQPRRGGFAPEQCPVGTRRGIFGNCVPFDDDPRIASQLPQQPGIPAPPTVPEPIMQNILQALPAGQCPKGFRPNKTDYFLKDGTMVRRGSRCVKIRRTNPDNGRASTRAARRLLTRKRHQDRIDKALRSIAPTPRRRSAPARRAASGQVIVAGN